MDLYWHWQHCLTCLQQPGTIWPTVDAAQLTFKINSKKWSFYAKQAYLIAVGLFLCAHVYYMVLSEGGQTGHFFRLGWGRPPRIPPGSNSIYWNLESDCFVNKKASLATNLNTIELELQMAFGKLTCTPPGSACWTTIPQGIQRRWAAVSWCAEMHKTSTKHYRRYFWDAPCVFRPANRGIRRRQKASEGVRRRQEASGGGKASWDRRKWEEKKRRYVASKPKIKPRPKILMQAQKVSWKDLHVGLHACENIA